VSGEESWSVSDHAPSSAAMSAWCESSAHSEQPLHASEPHAHLIVQSLVFVPHLRRKKVERGAAR